MTGIVLTALFFLFPGLLLTLRKDFFPRLFLAEKIPICIALSLAYWIIGFWFLKFFRVPLHYFLVLSLFLSVFLFAAAWYRTRRFIPIHVRTIRTNGLILGLFLLLAVPGMLATRNTVAPGGADMSMHAYLSKIIYLTDGFPDTMEPLVPLERFTSYPVGFPVLIADMMLLNKLPVYTNALWLSVFTYWFFTLCIYTLVRSKFPFLISAITAAAVTWVSLTPNDFIEWGANPTILSLDVLLISIVFFFHLKQQYSLFFLFVTAYCALLIHYIMPAGLGYISLMYIPLLWRHVTDRFTHDRKAFLLTMLTCVLITTPFLFHILQNPVFISERAEIYVKGLHLQEILEWSGNPSSLTPEAIRFLIGTLGTPIIILYLVSLAITGVFRPKRLLLHAVYVTGIMILIMNARVWWIPFSSLLYPKRMVVLLTIPIALGLAEGMSHGAHAVRTYLSSANRYMLVALTMILAVIAYYPHVDNHLKRFIRSGNLSVVTRQDLDAMQWLSNHTKPSDIILNNYEDAGLWIPAITNRQITLYHTNPIDMGQRTVNRGKETYAFIGNKTFTANPQSNAVNADLLVNDPARYTRMYASGMAEIYKINSVR